MLALPRTAFVLGAGLGTRLRPLTSRLPKPLIPVCQKPLITFAFDELINRGIERIVINTHHCANAYTEAFPGLRYRGVPLLFRHEEKLLETAGGIKNVEDLIASEPFIVYNGDILSDLPFEKAFSEHQRSGNEVTLVLRSGVEPRQITWDPEGRVVDIGGRLGAAGERLLFTGIYIVEPAFFRRIPPATKLSVVPIFLEMIREGTGLGGVVIDEGQWWDLGTREKYLEVHRHFAQLPAFGGGPWIAPSAKVDRSARISGATVLGPGTVIGPRSCIHDSILWEDASLGPDSHLENCIVTRGRQVAGSFRDTDF